MDFEQFYSREAYGGNILYFDFADVLYYSVKYIEKLTSSKKLKFDYVSVARGALLHDFYLDGDERLLKRKFLDTFTHPKKALITSLDNFSLNRMEQNIIVSHMFPIYPAIPKYKESWIVDVVDDISAIHERLFSIRKKVFYYAKCFAFFFFFFIN